MRIAGRATALLCAAIAAGCNSNQPAAEAADRSSASVPDRRSDRAGTISVAAFRFTGWQDESFHYLPALSVSAPSTGRPVLVHRIDFTADDAGARRLLKGVRYTAGQRVEPGSTVVLVPEAATVEQAEISSPLALDSVSAIIFFTDDDGQTGIVSAVARVPDVRRRPGRPRRPSRVAGR
jgi:hypothetical protein